jgi:ribosome-binding ATPase YchF (GTP1/OBG family)
MVNNMLMFMLGFVSSLITFTAYGWHRLKKTEKAKKTFLEELKKRADEIEKSMAPVKDKMARVQEITKQQMDLLGMVDQPSKNSLHSKWKNGLNSQIRQLEEEKMEILKSILREGQDPVITVLNEKNERESIKLSEYMARNGFTLETKSEKKITDGTEGEPKKVGRFTVHVGGKGEPTSH